MNGNEILVSLLLYHKKFWTRSECQENWSSVWQECTQTIQTDLWLYGASFNTNSCGSIMHNTNCELLGALQPVKFQHCWQQNMTHTQQRKLEFLHYSFYRFLLTWQQEGWRALWCVYKHLTLYCRKIDVQKLGGGS